MGGGNTYLGAGVDCVTNVESSRSIQEDPVEEVTLTRAVHACHGQHTNGPLQGLQEFSRLLVNLELCTWGSQLIKKRAKTYC